MLDNDSPVGRALDLLAERLAELVAEVVVPLDDEPRQTDDDSPERE